MWIFKNIFAIHCDHLSDIYVSQIAVGLLFFKDRMYTHTSKPNLAVSIIDKGQDFKNFETKFRFLNPDFQIRENRSH